MTASRERGPVEPVPCIGLVGLIFGHKFRTVERYHDFCQRCGVPKGALQHLSDGES